MLLILLLLLLQPHNSALGPTAIVSHQILCRRRRLVRRRGRWVRICVLYLITSLYAQEVTVAAVIPAGIGVVITDRVETMHHDLIVVILTIVLISTVICRFQAAHPRLTDEVRVCSAHRRRALLLMELLRHSPPPLLVIYELQTLNQMRVHFLVYSAGDG